MIKVQQGKLSVNKLDNLHKNGKVGLYQDLAKTIKTLI